MLLCDRSFPLPDDDISADSHSLDDGCQSVSKGPSQEPYLPAEMRSEPARLRTFHTWPPSSGSKLARYGFYAIREGDCIRCAFCGLEVCGFSSTQEVKLWHRQMAGRGCPFLTGKAVAEKTEAKVVVGRDQSREAALRVETSRRTERLQLLKSTPGDLQNSTPSALTNSSSPSEASRCAMPTSPLRNSASQRLASHTVSNSHVLKSGTERRQLQERINPYRPTSFIPTPTNSNPASSTPTGCLPAGTTPESSTQASSTPAGSRPSGSSAVTMTWADIVRTAHVPDMVPYQTRLQSFTSWPLLTPTPHSLARAGFFRDTKPPPSPPPPLAKPRHTCPQLGGASSRGASARSSGASGEEERDTVRCFWCGERVHRWQKSDDPVLEHARLSPGCRYVIQLLGRQLHRDVIGASV